MKVLVVEAEEVLKGSLELFFGRLKSWEVLSADSADEGRQLFLRHAPFDLVLCGDRLPDGSGLELLKGFLVGNPGLRSVLMTVQGDEKLARQAARAGVGGFLVKPFDLRQLEAVMGKEAGKNQSYLS